MTSLTAQSAARTLGARTASLPPLPQATTGGPPGFLRPFANERLNSRLSAALPSGTWSSAWAAAVDTGILPVFALAHGASVLAAGRRGFQFFVDGKAVANAVSIGEDAELRPESGDFVIPDRYSRIASFSLASGAPGAYFTASGANDTRRTFLHRRARSSVVASIDDSRSPHNPIPKQVSYLEVFDAAGATTATRDAEFGPLRVAMHNDFIVLARPGAIDFLDLTLTAQRRIEAAMNPLGLSLDETGRMYLLCEIGHRQHFWTMAPSGEHSAVALPEEIKAFHRPAIIGYDHRAYLLSLNRILTVNPQGRLDWQYNSPDRIAGAVITTDGQLLTAVGDMVLALNAQGESRVLCRVSGEQAMAAPILGTGGELYVLTDRRLHCFRAR